MAENTKLNIVIQLTDKASTGLKNFSKRMDSLGKSVKKLGTSLTTKVTAPIAAIAGLSIKSAAKLESLEIAFDRLTASAGISGDEIVSALDKAAAGTVSRTDLILSANKAMSLGVASSTEEFVTLMEIARVKGQAMGLDVTQAFNDIVTGLGRSSPLILDNLGITIKLGEANELYAEKLGKTVEQLTNQERKQALINKVVSEGREEIAAMGDVQLTSAEKMAQLTVQIKEMGADIGAVLLPIVIQIVEVTKQWLERFAALDDRTKKIIVVIALAVAAIGPLLLIISSIITITQTLIVVFGLLLSPIGLVVVAIAALIAISVLIIKNWSKIKAFLISTWEAIKNIAIAVFSVITQFITERFEFLLSIIKTFTDAALGLWNNFWDAIKGKAVSIADTVKSIVSSMVDFIKNKINGTIGAVNSFATRAAKVVGFTAPQIPMLADGGIVRKPTLAMIGESGPEAVIPLNKANSFGGGGTTINVIINGDVMGDDGIERLGDELVRTFQLISPSSIG